MIILVFIVVILKYYSKTNLIKYVFNNFFFTNNMKRRE